MAEHGADHAGAVLERAPDGEDSPLDALFFVIIALFLGEWRHTCPLQQLQSLQTHSNASHAGVFTKHALAWTKLPFTALLLVSFTPLLFSQGAGQAEKQVNIIIAGVGGVVGDWQRDIHQELGFYRPWHSILGGITPSQALFFLCPSVQLAHCVHMSSMHKYMYPVCANNVSQVCLSHCVC